MAIPPTVQDRILSGLWGSLIGDALGVPVEFSSRAQCKADPVTGLREYGVHHQPRGTWSDDGALLLCSVDSLVAHEFDTQDMGRRFVQWRKEAFWSSHGVVFDIGTTTATALRRIDQGTPAEQAGGRDIHSNGNGSLMRILPAGIRFAHLPAAGMLDRVHRASSITHGHPRTLMACGFHALTVAALLEGATAPQAVEEASVRFREHYGASSDDAWTEEWQAFNFVLDGKLASRREDEIVSDGYSVNTLVASLWCLLTTGDFRECVLKAVNLGSDTDTTGCVAGGLAGLLYGGAAVPEEWQSELPRAAELEKLFKAFGRLVVNQRLR